jgi:hypothetical protein
MPILLGRFAPTFNGSKRPARLIYMGFSNILARFFSRARVEK